MKKLNLGCGKNKISGCINVDIESSVDPDVVADFRVKVPFESEEFDEIYFLHTIEHIEKKHHFAVFSEIRRVLKPEGKLIVAYPEFTRCLENWLSNKNGDRQFWEATIYGRQLYPGDYHHCAIHSPDLKTYLQNVGFKSIDVIQDPTAAYNSVLFAYKGLPTLTYEELLYKEIFA